MLNLFKRNPYRAAAQRLYDQLVIASRQPYFYAECRVPDTVEGRFEVLAIHVFMIMNRLRHEQDEAKAAAGLSQALFDAMFRNMDFSFREAGVGDLAVPKKMKFMMTSFNGRCHSYADVVFDRAKLADAIQRNVYGPLSDIDERSVQFIADYMGLGVAALAALPYQAIFNGILPNFSGAFGHEKAA